MSTEQKYDARMSTHPLTREQFERGASIHRGVALTQPDDGDFILAYGHVPAPQMATAVVDFIGSSEVTEDEVLMCTAHAWAVNTIDPSVDFRLYEYNEWEWWIVLDGVTEATPNAFPVTTVELS